MKTKTKAAPVVFHRHSFSERLLFMSKPNRETRTALRLGGWKWNVGGGYWWRHTGATEPIKPGDLANLLVPAEQPEAATA